MSESDRIDVLKKACLRLFEFKGDYETYENEAIKLADRVVSLKLNHTIDPGHLKFFLIIHIKNKLRFLNRKQFDKLINDYFKVKKTDYYFQISELESFPDNYRLGYGRLLTFDSLPQPVKTFAESLSNGKIIGVKQKTEKILKEIVKKIVIPSDPHVGYWLKITTSAISYIIQSTNAFESAEESLDILRIATPTSRVHLPQYAIGINTGESKAFLATAAVEFSRYPYHPRMDKLIDRLSDICVKPSSELEKRIKNALHFYRIGDNFSPNHPKIFFYVASIEHLILGRNDRDVLRWKFSEKGAILLADDSKERLGLSNELKGLYDKRSIIVHGGKFEYDFFGTTSARRHLHNIIMKILHLIDTCGLQRVAPKDKKKKAGEALDEYVENIIYSG